MHLRLNNKNMYDFEPRWKQSLATLGLYVDLLAPELLALWNIRDEVPVSLETKSQQKVFDWLSGTSNFSCTQPQNESMERTDCAPIDTKEIINLEPELLYLDDSEIEEVFLPKVISKTNRKKKKASHIITLD